MAVAVMDVVTLFAAIGLVGLLAYWIEGDEVRLEDRRTAGAGVAAG